MKRQKEEGREGMREGKEVLMKNWQRDCMEEQHEDTEGKRHKKDKKKVNK